jgi:hypothetical protein
MPLNRSSYILWCKNDDNDQVLLDANIEIGLKSLWTNMGANSLRCTKILSQRHPFLFFSPSPFLPCKYTFMDDYDGIYNCNSLKYSHFENFDNF